MKDQIKSIGGFLVIIMIALLIGLVWFDKEIMLKLIFTNVLLILAVWIIDKSHK